MLYGHRRDVDGYAKALAYFDEKLPEIQAHMKPDDILMITADHGCDPAYTATTDHTREYTPFLMYGAPVTTDFFRYRSYGIGLFRNPTGV